MVKMNCANIFGCITILIFGVGRLSHDVAGLVCSACDGESSFDCTERWGNLKNVTCDTPPAGMRAICYYMEHLDTVTNRVKAIGGCETQSTEKILVLTPFPPCWTKPLRFQVKDCRTCDKDRCNIPPFY
ncbi:hypothetical protein PPYR_12536 [Photinus pyralis]|uniref:Protein quiver n=1 Tax=Photinus pyralis TaxID=7054 RepID=A0A1Y1N049_PHOPY|nr:hypothetical protein PPYR_12536 [Photinus pyralis]